MSHKLVIYKSKLPSDANVVMALVSVSLTNDSITASEKPIGVPSFPLIP